VVGEDGGELWEVAWVKGLGDVVEGVEGTVVDGDGSVVSCG